MPEDKELSSRFVPIVTVIALLVAGSLVPKGGGPVEPSSLAHRNKSSTPHRKMKDAGLGLASAHRGKSRRPKPPVELAASESDGVDLSAYRDLGSWIDIYDEGPWAHPAQAVARLHRRGAKTIFLQTSNWGAKEPIFKRRQTAIFLESAHKRGMKVVAWSVPSFARRKFDYLRARAAILFKRRGHSFDSFGLDIEATTVADISKRNKSMLHISKRLRKLVGPDYTLAAITPDPVRADYWPDFPYRAVTKLYDVVVPMGYFSFRTNGYKGVKRYTLASIRNIREASGDPDVPIHFIGGLGGETKTPEVKAFVRTVRDKDVLGASYYDFSVTSNQEWAQLKSLVHQPKPEGQGPDKTQDKPEVTVPEPRPTALGVVGNNTVGKGGKKASHKHRVRKGDRRKHRDGKRERDGKNNRPERDRKRDGDGKRDRNRDGKRRGDR